MLNEIGEYKQYTLSPEELAACKNRRLKQYTLIKQKFGGLERAMTIIARHFIFKTSVVDFDEKAEKELREILKAWCGFKHEAKTSLPEHFEGWLNNYIRIFLSEKVQSYLDAEKNPTDLKSAIENISLNNAPTAEIKNLLGALDKLSKKNTIFSKSLFGGLDAKGDTPFRAITYDKVIANALLAGKLRRYYLVCDEELFQTKKIFKSDKRDKKLSAKDKDMVLKMTAEYLLQRRYTSQEFVATNNANIINWLSVPEKSERLAIKRGNYLLAETEEKIFEIGDEIEGLGVTKIKLCHEWKKHFSLVEDDDNLDSKLGRIFFSDIGSGEFLKENVRY